MNFKAEKVQRIKRDLFIQKFLKSSKNIEKHSKYIRAGTEMEANQNPLYVFKKQKSRLLDICCQDGGMCYMKHKEVLGYLVWRVIMNLSQKYRKNNLKLNLYLPIVELEYPFYDEFFDYDPVYSRDHL